MENNKLLFQIGISLIPDVGAILAKRLIAYTGSPEAVFKEKKQNLEKIPGIGKNIIGKINQKEILQKAENEINFIRDYHLQTSFYTEKSYPERLKQCEDGPVIFFYKGDTDFNAQKIISIVGTRDATDYGRDFTYNLIKELKERNHGATIVSGLAYGIDIAAHRASLENELPTIAVLGHGMGTIYPAVHRSTAAEIASNGALVSEFISTDKPDRPRFVRRNRVIAGLSDATIIVESTKKGGALITAEIANSYNRDVFALPGKLSDRYSQGCNHLIKIHKAHLMESVNDLEYIMGWDTQPEIQQKILFPEINDIEKKILNVVINHGEVSIDVLALETGFKMNTLSSTLLEMEFKDLLKALPGKKYKTALKNNICI